MSPAAAAKARGARTLAVDVGGTNIKILAEGQSTAIKIPSGPTMNAASMVKSVLDAAGSWQFDRVSIGYPAPVQHNKPMLEPHNLAPGWVGFNYPRAFGKPVLMINDAAMQALGSYSGGRMLFLGLGTGLGSALVIEGIVHPLELAHLPYRHGRTYEDYVGLRGIEKYGKKRWRERVADVVDRFQAALDVDYVILGGGNAKLLKTLPKGAKLGANDNAFKGGFMLWRDHIHAQRSAPGTRPDVE